jgi:hypothetical protein
VLGPGEDVWRGGRREAAAQRELGLDYANVQVALEYVLLLGSIRVLDATEEAKFLVEIALHALTVPCVLITV